MKIKINDRYAWINYHHLYCFFVIATEGSIARASKILSIGSSALSIQIKQLEQNLEIELFERSHRKLILNENGRLIFSYAKEIFRLGNEMIEVVQDKPTSGRVHLQVGALDTIPKHLTLQLVKAAMKSGKCSISIYEGRSDELLVQLREHKIDLVVTNAIPTAVPASYVHRRIAKLPLWVVGDRSFLNLRKNFPRSLHGQCFVMPTSDSSVRQEIDSFFKHHQIAPDIIAEAQDVMVQKLIALEGIGMTVVPEFAISDFLKNKRLYLIGRIKDAFEDLFLISASRRIENPVASKLMKEFKI